MLRTNEEQIQVLRHLLENDEDLRALSKFKSKINIFSIIKNGATEIRHSNILAWLLQPNENHGLHNLFLREFIKLAIRNNPAKANILEWAFLDYSDVWVDREKQDIDLLIRFETAKHIVVIENKTNSNEHDAAQTGEKQTIIYRQRIEKEYPKYTPLYIYLTPTGEAPADDIWCTLSYEDILSIIESQLLTEDLAPEVSLILSNYCSLIKSDVIGKDNDLFYACNAVYQNHSDAFDLLFQYINKKKNVNTQLTELCAKIYSLYELELSMVRSNWQDPVARLSRELFDCIHSAEEFALSKTAGKRYISFSSQRLDQYLPQLNQNISSWGSTNTYLFWLCTDNYLEKGELRLALELGGWNLPEDTQKNQQSIISTLKPNDKRPEFQYKIVRSTSLKITQNPSAKELNTFFAQVIQIANEWIDECTSAINN